MEKNSRKWSNRFWWCIYMLPMIYSLLYMLVFVFSVDYQVANATKDLGEVITNGLGYLSSTSIASIFNDSFINDSLFDLLSFFGVESTNVLVKLMVSYVSWYIILIILHIGVDFILFIPNLVKSFVRKYGGDLE